MNSDYPVRPGSDRPSIAQLRAELERTGSRSGKRKHYEDEPDDDYREITEAEEGEKPPRRKSGWRIFLRILLIVLLVAALLAAAVILLFPSFVVYGNSMAPSLLEGDMVVAATDGSPRVGDLVAFRSGERILIKRVAGCPGDTVEVLEDGSVLLNGEPLSEPWAILSTDGAGELDYPVTLPEDGYFLLGDNRSNSIDSRNRVLGVIDEAQIDGRLVLRVWPLNRIALLAPDAFSGLLHSVRLPFLQ